jgi:predicted ribosomally synthesized peptide with nif11-like leader
MSVENAKSFIKAVAENKDLQAQIASEQWDLEAALPLAQELGLNFSVEDLAEANDELIGHLSSEELEKIAGGSMMGANLGAIAEEVSGTLGAAAEEVSGKYGAAAEEVSSRFGAAAGGFFSAVGFMIATNSNSSTRD